MPHHDRTAGQVPGPVVPPASVHLNASQLTRMLAEGPGTVDSDGLVELGVGVGDGRRGEGVGS